ncbi:YihY/virulence factor BrkB family protein [Microbacter sp. GSS18]|nr:YihY/virulence factor BrkB family protein [Microbacter sp. GSS18]
MAAKGGRERHKQARGAADAAALEEQTLRHRWELTQESLKERFDQPIERATAITRVTLGWFPVRVWRHFLQHNGFLLAAGVSYQALFAAFAAIYVAFAIAGIWLGGSDEAIDGLIAFINSYIPGLIAPEGGVFTPDQVEAVADSTTGVLGITGVIALGTLIWTAIGSITFARRAVRDIFGIPPDRRNYLLLKSTDFLAAGAFGTALLLGWGLTSAGTFALNWVFSLFDWSRSSIWYNVAGALIAFALLIALNTAVIGSLVKFLTGTALRWRQIWPGAMLGGFATALLQIGAGIALAYTPTNVLLATFAVFIGLLLWFRLVGIVLLVAASWMAVSAGDADMPILKQSEADRLITEHRALLVAARVRLRTAQEAAEHAPWYRRWQAKRAVREAETELDQVEAAKPPEPKKASLFE